MAFTSMTLAKSPEHQSGWRLICDGLTRYNEVEPGAWQVNDASTGQRYVVWVHEVSPLDDHVRLPSVHPEQEDIPLTIEDLTMDDEAWIRANAIQAAAAFCDPAAGSTVIWRFVAEFEEYVRTGRKPVYGQGSTNVVTT